MIKKKSGEEDHFQWEINDAQRDIEEVYAEIDVEERDEEDRAYERDPIRYAMKYNSDYIYPNSWDFLNLEDPVEDDTSRTEDTSDSMIANL